MSAITGNTVSPAGLWEASQPVVHKVIPSLDPSEIVHMAEGPTPSLLHIAVLMQKWVPLRLLIDYRAPSQMSWKNNPQECQEFCDRFVSTQKLDGVVPGKYDGNIFLLPRGVPYVPTVFQDGSFKPLHPTPYSAATKPIAIFFIGNDWAGDHSAATSKRFAKVYHRHYAQIAKHFTVVRVLIGNPSQIVPTIKNVKALLPGVPVLVVSVSGHGFNRLIALNRVLPMTFSDVKNAFKREVHKRLRKSAGDEVEVRTQLLSGIATGKTRFPGVPFGMTANSPKFIQEISAEIAFGGSFLFDSCNSAAGDDNLARTFSEWAPGLTVYGSPIELFNFIPKVFYTSTTTPQLIPFYLKNIKETPGSFRMHMRAYRGNRLRADVSDEFPKPANNSDVRRRHLPDIDRSLYMGIEMTQLEFNDPQWLRLIQAIGDPDRSAFAGSVCILAHDQGVCSHSSKKANTDETSPVN